jgi:prepilin-type N-terminal cleavage/methylation domain-containing protein
MKTSIASIRYRSCTGFTLVELMISVALAVLTGAGAYALLETSMTLYAKNFSINQSHYTARLPLELIALKVNGAGASPILVDKAGADVAGDGPAAGMRYCTPVTSASYVIPTAAGKTATSLKINASKGAPKLRDSDVVLINTGPQVAEQETVQVEIASVSGTTSPYSVTLKKPVGVEIPAGTPATVLQQGAFIAVDNQLRYYPKVMSVARHGTTAFNAAANFRVIGNVLPAPNAAQPLPFSYSDTARRLLRVNVRATSSRYDHRVSSYNSFSAVESSIAIRSIFLDAKKLTPIN